MGLLLQGQYVPRRVRPYFGSVFGTCWTKRNSFVLSSQPWLEEGGTGRELIAEEMTPRAEKAREWGAGTRKEI